MEFLSPWSLLWLGLAGPLVALYILKRRRARREVASTLLWEAALRDLRAERPWKRLIPHLSLLLQLLVLLLGAIALARPVGAGRLPDAAKLAVVIDTSASMGARVEEGSSETRLERAVEVAESLSRGLAPGAEMMLIEAGPQPTVLSPFTRDASTLALTLRELRLRGQPADIEAAVSLAAERLRGGPDGSRVVLLTDAAMDGEVALDGRTVDVEVQRIGEDLSNVAIVAADARPNPSREHPDKADVFARIRNFGEETFDLFVTAEVQGRGLVASRRLTVGPDGTESVVMPADLPPDTSGRPAFVRIRIARDGPGDAALDALAADDRAVVPSPGARKLPVFFIGLPAPHLERVLRTDANVELFTSTLAALEAREEQTPLDGLIIYSGDVPEEAPPGDSVVVAPIGDQVFEARLAERVEGPRIVTWDEEDPRLRFVTLSDVHLGSIRPIRSPAARVLVNTSAGPAVASIDRPNGETTLVAFEPSRSDWPRKESFVIFFRNLLERARARRAAGGVEAGSLGQPLRIPAPEGEDVTVTAPDGERLIGRSRGGVAVVPIGAEPGIYQVEVGRRELSALRNLLNAEESDISPRARFTRGGEATGEVLTDAVDHVESWPWFVGFLLLILLLEAVWATRRGPTSARAASLWDRLRRVRGKENAAP
ncbi:MAG: BatA and WFA domain-containing protein [Myxococcota bacterium]